VGDILLFIDSRDRVSIAVNQGNYSKKFAVEPPGTIFIPRKGAALKDSEGPPAPHPRELLPRTIVSSVQFVQVLVLRITDARRGFDHGSVWPTAQTSLSAPESHADVHCCYGNHTSRRHWRQHCRLQRPRRRPP